MATRYIHFTEEQKQAARQIDIAGLLHSQGETLKRSGGEYEWRDGLQKVTIRGNLWFHQYDRQGGDAIDFVRRYYNKSYPEAVEYLLGGRSGTLAVSPPIEKETKPFELPPKNDRMSRVYAYLIRHRKIDKDVLDVFVHKGMIYESADYHNAVFVGFDTDALPVMPISEEQVRRAATKGISAAACRNTAFIGTGRAKGCICLKRRLTCSHLSL